MSVWRSKYTLSSIRLHWHSPRFFPQPPLDKHKHPFSRYMTPACRSKVLHGAQGLDQGRVEGGKCNNEVYSTYRSDNRTTSQGRHLHAACVPLQSLAAARVHDRVKIEEGR